MGASYPLFIIKVSRRVSKNNKHFYFLKKVSWNGNEKKNFKRQWLMYVCVSVVSYLLFFDVKLCRFISISLNIRHNILYYTRRALLGIVFLLRKLLKKSICGAAPFKSRINIHIYCCGSNRSAIIIRWIIVWCDGGNRIYL